MQEFFQAFGADGDLCLSPHRRTWQTPAERLGSHPGRDGLHAAKLRLSRPFLRIARVWRGTCLRALDPDARLSARGCAAPEPAFPAGFRCRAWARQGAEAADLRCRWNDVAHTADHGDRRRHRDQDILSGLSARQECGRGFGLARRSAEISARLGENIAKHFWRQYTGIRIVARTVIAIE